MKDGELKIVKPTEDAHPVLIGTYYEDQKNRPGWKYSSGAEGYIKDKLENPLEDVPICRKDEDACDPAKQFYDRWLSPENAEEYCPNCYSRPYHHYGTADKGVPDRWFYALWPPVPSKIYSARDRGYGGGRGSDGKNPTRMTFIDGIKQYNKYTDQGKKNAYLMLGHVMHLLQDQSEPDHTRLVPHPASGKSEPAWFDEIYVCEIRSAEAGLAAFGFCPPGFKFICFAIAAAVGLRDCKDSIDKDDVGFEWLVDNHWVMSEREELASQIEARGVQRQPNYDSFFQALGDYVNQKVEELGFKSDFADGNSLGCSTLLIPPEIPAGDPDIDTNNEEEKNRYLALADHVASGAVCLGAGFLEYFYEVVNHPPYVQRVVVTTGGRGIPRLLDRGEGREAEIIYDAHWDDILDEETKTTVRRRVFRKMSDQPFNPQHEAFLYIELGPQLEPEKGKVASRIEVNIGSFSSTPSLRRAPDGTPVYMVVIPAGALAMNCGESEIAFPIKIRAWDKSAHLGIRPATGEEIDAQPISIATVETESGNFEFVNYEPGTDRIHVLRLLPTTWEIAVSTDPDPIPPPGTPPWAMPAIPIAAPASGTKTDAIYLKAFSPKATGSPSVTVYVPTSCPVEWTAGSVAGPLGEGSSDSLYHFQLNIPNPASAVAKLEVMTNPATTRGPCTIMVNYMVGTIRRTLGIPIEIY
jgi:hypothetical protein